ncbi:hypothetical protein PsYK624_075780 [Phanerochaete sordida]|uniref:P-loop containing nucleoside triphosphate hydrolase protein n=1 Tax=Phanerochaete sordida TaxID=48140 RepID=A0A9P3G8Q8_9APHY|nr:hypothetical protein PsYK624_075780 [Phanerochaete sordida]
MEPAPKVSLMREHVLVALSRHRAEHTKVPLFVAVQGPQGSGKTFLTTRLREALVAEDSLKVAVLSIDDLYLPHEQLVAVAKAYPENRLLQGRGQPGTHDVDLGTQILTRLKRINEDTERKSVVHIPKFDKSLHGGEGDRVLEGTDIEAPVDVVVLEGWCVGFYPSSEEEINRRFELPVQGLGDDFFRARGFRKEDVLDINERLKHLASWWSYFDAFIQIKPVESHPYDYIYKWRLQQEHNMKAQNGGKGMTDEQVEKFVDRYIPGYVFFGDGVTNGQLDKAGGVQRPPWLGNGLCIQIGEGREVVNVSKF